MARVLFPPEASCSKRAEGGGPRCPFSGDQVAGVDFGRGGVGGCGKRRVAGSCGILFEEVGGSSCGKMLVARRILVDVGRRKEYVLGEM